MEPTIANSIVPLRELNVAHILERMLKLSIPTLYGWVIIFYALFHVWLNILAEVTYFGDREFYKVGQFFICSKLHLLTAAALSVK